MVIYLIVINIVSFVLYGIDKKRAIKHQYRIAEKYLLFLSIVGGCLGSLFGIMFFHHKNKHLKFVIFVPICNLLWLFLLLCFL